MTEQLSRPQTHGFTAPGFEPVREAFERNFAEFNDTGAAFALYHEGELVVDIWGGLADAEAETPWAQDTIGIVYSATKAATAIVVHQLAEKGLLDLDAPVANVWPEFAAGGKEAVTTRTLLSHRAGLPAIEGDLTLEQLLAGTPVADLLAAQSPVWDPSTSHGYHALTYGWLIGEVVRRATGRTVGELFAENIAVPLNLDFYIGLPSEHVGRVAPLVASTPPAPDFLDAITDPDAKAAILARIGQMMDPTSLLSRTLSSNGLLPTPNAPAWNDPAVYAAEIPAANGIADARSLAKMYAALLGEIDGIRLLEEETVTAAIAEQSEGIDEVTMAQSRFGSGFMLDSEISPLPTHAFGHYGAGGSLGFADPSTGITFGYVTAKLGGTPTGEPRTAGLIAAVGSVLESKNNAQ
ncbi:serine hydrolase domain-containing protein [Rhodococcoides yunnanense]|uniref:serine hydrolase domain-containing protein n=1 Tax=Rhodococcoides yunnanense TaxID=278209 RepID=UPI0009327E40|nr:serine hydrolase domain-containing protein [Rhodococcus yunnanensis]